MGRPWITRRRRPDAEARPERPPGRRLPWGRLVGIGILLIAMSLATARLFVWPSTAEASRADAVVMLSGDHGERLPLALRLVETEGLAATLVLAGSPDTAAADRLCQGGMAYEVVCLRPDPDSTRTEAQATANLAVRRGWGSLIIVTSTQHATRARLLFDRCFGGRLLVIGARPPYGTATTAGQIGHEWLGLAQALVLRRSC